MPAVFPQQEKASWAERIPAAIAKAEGSHSYPRFIQGVYPGHNDYLVPGEVALAKALWEAQNDSGPDPEPDGALRAFVEKVEAL